MTFSGAVLCSTKYVLYGSCNESQLMVRNRSMDSLQEYLKHKRPGSDRKDTYKAVSVYILLLTCLLCCTAGGMGTSRPQRMERWFPFFSMRVSNTAEWKKWKEPPHRSLPPPCLNHQTQKLGDGNIPWNPLTYNDAMTLLNFSHSTQQIRAAETENISLLCMP